MGRNFQSYCVRSGPSTGHIAYLSTSLSAILIFIMALTMLRIDKAKAKWRTKLSAAFVNNSSFKSQIPFFGKRDAVSSDFVDRPKDVSVTGSKWALFLLPFITVMREGLEAVVFIGGVSVPTIFLMLREC